MEAVPSLHYVSHRALAINFRPQIKVHATCFAYPYLRAFFCSTTNATITHPAQEQKANMATNHRNDNLNGGNMYDLWVINAVSS